MNDLLIELPWNNKIKTLRKKNGWSQQETADKCCTTQKAFWSWESGSRYPRKMNRRIISNAFGVKEFEIFG